MGRSYPEQPEISGERALQFREWIRAAFEGQSAYDRLVRAALERGSSYENPAANFFRVTRDAKPTMEKSTRSSSASGVYCCSATTPFR
jgi:hypothetical protein